MQNKTLLFILIGILLLGGVFPLAGQQKSSVAPTDQVMEESFEVTEGDEEVMTEDETMEEEEVMEEGDLEEDMQVSLTDAGFEPQTITVAAGSMVVWVNDTEATGNVSSAVHPTHEEYPPLNLSDFEPGESVSLVFDEPGTYKYHDHLNPSKFGTVVVE